MDSSSEESSESIFGKRVNKSLFDNVKPSRSSRSDKSDDLLSIPAASRPTSGHPRSNKRLSEELTDKEISEVSRFEVVPVTSGLETTSINGNGGGDSPTASRSSTATFGGSRTGTPLLDQTISAAFRTRIRSRIKTAKENVKSSSTISLPSRSFETDVGDLGNVVESRLKNRGDWRSALVSLIDPNSEKQSDILPKPDESYDFFTQTFTENAVSTSNEISASTSPTHSETSKAKSGQSSIQIEDDESKDDSDSGKLLVKNLFTSTEYLQATVRSETTLRSRQERQSAESKVLTFTQNKPISDYIRFGRSQGFDPRQDGLYIERPPKAISGQNMNKLCQRLYRDSGLAWFQGRFKTLFDILWNYFTTWSILINSFKLKSSSTNDKLYDVQPIMLKRDFFEQEAASKTIKYELLLTINCIQFDFHWLFADETAIASRVISLAKRYERLHNEATIAMINRKIESLRISISNISSSSQIELAENDPGNKIRQTRLSNYREQLADAFEARRTALQELRSILVELLSSWEELLSKRSSQGFTSTSVRLNYSEEANAIPEKQEQEEWTRQVQEDFSISKIVQREIYDRQLDEYRKRLRAWKSWQRKIRRDSRQERIEITEGLVESPTNSKQEKTVCMTKPEPPEKPLDDESLYEKIKNETLLSDGRVPGEPKFTSISLTFDAEVTEIKGTPSFEQKRRLIAKKLKYFIEIKINGSIRSKTFDQEPDSNFLLTWDQRFKIELVDEPKDMKVLLWERNNSSKSAILISTIELPFPDAVVMSCEDNQNDLEAEFESRVEKSKCGGKLGYNAAWAMDEKGNTRSPMTPLYPTKNIGLDSLTWDEIQRLREKSFKTLDPNDADNIELIKTIENYDKLLKQDHEVEDSLGQNNLSMKELQFCDESEITSNPRFRLIQLRNQKHEKFLGLAIPLLEREIPSSLLEKTDELEKLSTRAAKGIEAKRAKALAILTRVRSKLIAQAQGSIDRPRTWYDLVMEPDSNGLKFGFNFLLPSHSRRPLHPTRKERKKISGILMNNSQVQLIITVMHAFNVPVRMDSSSDETVKHQSKLNSDLGCLSYESRVSPFVEVVFQRQIERTSTAEGAQPTWNETLSLRFKAPNDNLSPSSLTKITDVVYLNLFDEIPVETDDDGSTGIPQRLERRWLGSLKIPFSTLYLNSKIEGTFKLNTPPVLLGYDYDSRFFNIGQNLSSSSNLSPNTYLTLFLTIDPTLQLPEELSLKCDSTEPERLLVHGKKWETEVHSQFPNRVVRAFAIDLNAQFVLVTRYIRPIKPPESLLSNISITDNAMYRLARFVSLIPSIPDNIALPGLGDIWCSCDQFLEMLVGDEEEHAILLCNFFLYLGKRAGVILGFGIPEGRTAYVIVWEYTGEEPSVWNPISGEKFSIRDSYIPLNAIGTIFTSENVYANVQKHDHPNRLIYDVTKSSCWKPLFNRKFPNPGFPCVQPEIIEFEAIDEDYVKYLENNLEKHLRESLMRWRKKSRTFFNRSAIQQIRKILPRLEKKIGRLQQNDLVQELQDILTVHKMIGFPLNMAFTSEEAVTEAVYATGLHLIEDRKVDFALAVYLHPYPCNLISVWVYIAALLKDK